MTRTPASATQDGLENHYTLPSSLRPDATVEERMELDRVLSQASQNIARLRAQAWVLMFSAAFADNQGKSLADISSLSLFFDDEEPNIPALVYLTRKGEEIVFCEEREDFHRPDGSRVPMTGSLEELKDFLHGHLSEFPDGYLPRMCINRLKMPRGQTPLDAWQGKVVEMLSATERAEHEAAWLAADTASATSKTPRPRI